MSDWLESVKAGDTVILSSGHNINWIRKVERVTKTQVILEGSNSKYRRSGGRRVGATQWDFSAIKEGKKDLIDKILDDNKRFELIKCIEGIKLKEVSTQTLEAVLKQLNTHKTVGDK